MKVRYAIGRGKVGIVEPIPRFVPSNLSVSTEDIIVERAFQLMVASDPVSVAMRHWVISILVGDDEMAKASLSRGSGNDELP